MDGVRADSAEWVGGSVSGGVRSLLRLNNYLRIAIRSKGGPPLPEGFREIEWEVDCS